METGIIVAIVLIVSLIVLFSPVTYSILSRLLKSVRVRINKVSKEDKIAIIQEINQAIEALAKNEKGATIVIDVREEVEEYITDSEHLDSLVSSNLMINIFEGSKTPLHDGAIIIQNNRITNASAYITKLSEQENLPKKFGTRHRSALGLAEVTKAIIIVLSEETGTCKIFHNSKWEDVENNELFNRIVELWV